jgi:hypothetical protein
VATQARAAQRKTRWSTPPPRPSPGTHAQPYRRRRPETTTLHRLLLTREPYAVDMEAVIEAAAAVGAAIEINAPQGDPGLPRG